MADYTWTDYLQLLVMYYSTSRILKQIKSSVNVLFSWLRVDVCSCRMCGMRRFSVNTSECLEPIAIIIPIAVAIRLCCWKMISSLQQQNVNRYFIVSNKQANCCSWFHQTVQSFYRSVTQSSLGWNFIVCNHSATRYSATQGRAIQKICHAFLGG